MNIKYHKIPGVEKTVCTAEQKIAYNLAFADGDILLRLVNDGKVKNAREAVETIFRLHDMENITKKYDIDGVFSALLAGIEKYIKNYAERHDFLFTSYEQIGEAFPALYL